MLVVDTPPPGDPSRDWYVWQVAGDELTCPVCAPLGNRLINGAQGPFPPLHTNCRCWLRYSHSDPSPPAEDIDVPFLPPYDPGTPGPF